MIDKLKKLWDSFGDKDFAKKFIPPTVGLFCTIGALSQYYCTKLEITDLVRVSGTVEWVSVTTESGTTLTKYYPLMISINGYEKPYRVKDTWKSRFKDLQQNIRAGDEIDIYSRNEFQTLLGWGQENDIFQIEKKGNVLFDIKWMRKYKQGQMEFFMVIGIIAWFFFGVYFYNRRSEKRVTKVAD